MLTKPHSVEQRATDAATPTFVATSLLEGPGDPGGAVNAASDADTGQMLWLWVRWACDVTPCGRNTSMAVPRSRSGQVSGAQMTISNSLGKSLLVRQDEAETLETMGVRLYADHDMTGGKLSANRAFLPAGEGPPPHPVPQRLRETAVEHVRVRVDQTGKQCPLGAVDRRHVHARRPRHRIDPDMHAQVTERFAAAALGGDRTS
ncbi:hypothetical protein ACW9HJ_20495 [Nocardia gipuzkoensis]